MTLVSSSIASLVNGVSQQVFTQRLPSQAEEQINFLSSIASGLKRRPPSRHIAKLTADDWSSAALHVINRDASERYLVVITAGDLRVFDLQGGEKSVSFPDGKGYLAANEASAAFRAVTVADYTFLLNRTVTTALTAAVTPTRPKEALVHVRLGNYGRTYKVVVDGVEAAVYKTPDGSAAAHAEDIDTSAIASELETRLSSAGLTDFTITRIQNAIHLQKSSGDFTISVEDGFNGDAMAVAKDQLQRFSDLPNIGPDGFTLEIVGDQTSAFDNYYVYFDKTAAEDSDGVWREGIAQGEPYQIDPATMPHVLVRQSDGSFVFRRSEWTDRTVGDTNSAPTPSFIGRKINDVVFFRNRLGFLADESVILSRASDFFTFWPKTVTAQLDGDPIDVASAHNQVSILQHATPFSRSLLLFSDQTQFVLEGGELLTPSTASIKATSDFAASLRAKPVSAGRQVYFAIEKGGSTGIREFYTDQSSDILDAAEITAHTLTLIPKGVTKLAAADNESMLLVLCDGAPNDVFAYRYHWSRDDKLQSAWSIWRFGDADRVLSADFIGSRLYLVIARSDGAYLEQIDLDAAATDPGSEQNVHVDRKVTEADCIRVLETVGGAQRTRLTLPYQEAAPLLVLAAADDELGATLEGRVLAHERLSANEIALAGDQTAAKFIIGRPYLSRYVFSPFFLREATPAGGSTAVGEGRLQILYLTLFYEDASAFRLLVQPKANQTFRYDFAGRISGAEANILGAPALESGRFKVPVYAQNTAVTIAVEADGPFGAAFLNAEWEGRAHLRSERR